MSYILEVDRLQKSFGAVAAVADLSMKVQEGEILGILGPNGAGKTTVFNLLAGAIKPDRGRIFFRNLDITHLPAPKRCRLGIGRTYQIPRPFEKMTVFENLLVGAVHGGGLDKRKGREIALNTLQLIGLTEAKDLFAGGLTLLNRKRLELGKALATLPKLLLIDEVAGGLTENEVEELISIVRNIKAGGVTIIWIEHILMMLSQGVDRLLVIDAGHDLLCGDPQKVMSSQEVQECYLGVEEDR